jgi:hypothetical protein
MKTNPLIQKFDEIFERKLKGAASQSEAYEEAEQEFESEHKHRKYSGIESYRKVRSKRIRKHRKKGN